MTSPQPIELTAAQAVSLVTAELQTAGLALQASELDPALNAYVRALGLALHLGPAPAEEVPNSILDGARAIAGRGDAEGLATLGPALAGLVDEVREAGALPASPVMEAWAAIATDIGAILGQWGLALSLPAERRQGLQLTMHSRAALLDAATDGLFGLAAWPELMPS